MIRIAVLLLAIAILPARSQEAQIVADTFHLSGPNVIRYQTMAGFTERQRLLIVGAHTGAGCGFHSRGPGRAGWMEWAVESDPDTCVELRARGPGIPPEMPLGSHHRVVYFSATFDSAAAKKSDTTRKKP